jgi:hypothetical protein
VITSHRSRAAALSSDFDWMKSTTRKQATRTVSADPANNGLSGSTCRVVGGGGNSSSGLLADVSDESHEELELLWAGTSVCVCATPLQMRLDINKIVME